MPYRKGEGVFVRFDDATKAQLNTMAEGTDTPRAEIIRKCCREWIAEHPDEYEAAHKAALRKRREQDRKAAGK